MDVNVREMINKEVGWIGQPLLSHTTLRALIRHPPCSSRGSFNQLENALFPVLRQASDANAILQRYQAVDLNARGRLYRDEGWSRFDPAAPAYTSDQVARERARYIVR